MKFTNLNPSANLTNGVAPFFGSFDLMTLVVMATQTWICPTGGVGVAWADLDTIPSDIKWLSLGLEYDLSHTSAANKYISIDASADGVITAFSEAFRINGWQYSKGRVLLPAIPVDAGNKRFCVMWGTDFDTVTTLKLHLNGWGW